MIKYIIFIIILMMMNCSIAQVIFESGWENATDELSRNSILDGGNWDDISNESQPHPSHESVDFNFKHSGKASFRINWIYHDGPDQLVGVLVDVNLPNPYYMRYYFYLEPGFQWTEGRKLLYWWGGDPFDVGQWRAGLRRGGTIDSEGEWVYSTSWVSPQYANYLEQIDAYRADFYVKGQTGSGIYDNVYNWPQSEHYDQWGPPGGSGYWPGCEPEPILFESGRWICVEQGIYRDGNNGWIKVWIDGKLKVKLDKNAWNGTFTESEASKWTTGYGLPTSFEMGCYFNYGPPKDQLEWIDDVVISGSYIGPMEDGNGNSAVPNQVTGLKIVK